MGVSKRQSAAEKKAAAKPKGKKAAVAASPKDKARTSTALVKAEGAAGDEALMPVGRILFRRNTDHQVDRCMQLKLGMFPRR